MRTRRFILSALAYLALTFPFAYVWHLVAFRPFYDRIAYFGNGEPIVALGFAAIAAQGLLLAYGFPFFQGGGKPIIEGLRFAAVFGAFLVTTQVVAAAAKHHAPATADWFLMEGLYMTIQFTLVGLAFGLINRPAKKGS